MVRPDFESSARSARHWPLALTLALAWLAYGACTVHQHGVTLDESSIFYAGDRTLFFLTHPWVAHALDFPRDVEPEGFHARWGRFPDFNDPLHYPAFPGLWMSVADALFDRGLHLVDDIDGHHLGLLALHGFGLFCFALFALRFLGTVPGSVAALSYALYPTIVGFGFNNPKDLPACDFYGATLLAVGAAFAHRRPRDLWAAGLLAGLSLSCKFNGVLAIATFWLWLLAVRPAPAELRRDGLWRPLLAFPVVASAVFFLLWPWLWAGSPVDWVTRVFEYLRFYSGFSHSDRPGPTAFALVAIGSMTPPLVLDLALLAVFGLWGPLADPASRYRRVRWLLAIWLGLPILRITLPHSEFYDANRHFIEYIGALSTFAGIGGGWVFRWLRDRPWGSIWAATAGAAGLFTLWLPLAAYRPYENAYFNFFVGGLGGAQERALFFMLTPPHDSRENGSEGDFWNSSLRDALQVAATLGPPGSRIGLCGPSQPNILANLSQPLPLRFTHWRDPQADLVYFMARECYCERSDLRQFESERPVLARVTRGGGLIYEILGPPSSFPLAPVTPHSRYEVLPHYRNGRAE